MSISEQCLQQGNDAKNIAIARYNKLGKPRFSPRSSSKSIMCCRRHISTIPATTCEGLEPTVAVAQPYLCVKPSSVDCFSQPKKTTESGERNPHKDLSMATTIRSRVPEMAKSDPTNQPVRATIGADTATATQPWRPPAAPKALATSAAPVRAHIKLVLAAARATHGQRDPVAEGKTRRRMG